MRWSFVRGVIVVLGVMAFAPVVFASQGDEAREKAAALKKEAAALMERGQKEQAEQLIQQVRELMVAADRRDAEAREPSPRAPEVQELEKRLHDLHAKEAEVRERVRSADDPALVQIRREITETERALRNRVRGPRPEGPEPRERPRELEEAVQRIRHLRIAAENLKAAGMGDVAEKLFDQAVTMERDLKEAQQRMARERDRGRDGQPPAPVEEIRQLRREVEQLRAEVREIHQKLEQHEQEHNLERQQ